MIISLGGMPGAGKSTVKHILAATLGLKEYSVGDLRRHMAKERGMTIEEFNALGEKEAFTDKDADEYQKKLGETEDDFIIDGRISWHFIPHSIKIFLDVDPAEAGKRIFTEKQSTPTTRGNEQTYASPEATTEGLLARLHSDQTRYKKWYGIDYLDRANYDFVIDTTHTPPEQVAEQILAYIRPPVPLDRTRQFR